jgi:hypothetical protein
MFDFEVYLIHEQSARRIIFAFATYSVQKREQHFFFTARRDVLIFPVRGRGHCILAVECGYLLGEIREFYQVLFTPAFGTDLHSSTLLQFECSHRDMTLLTEIFCEERRMTVGAEEEDNLVHGNVSF